VKKLENSELLIYELCSVEKLEERLDFMLLEKDFDSKLSSIENSLIRFTMGLTSLKSAQKLRTILGIIRSVGNYVNGGTFRGGAYGFSLDLLTKLKEIPTNEKNVSVLHLIAEIIAQDSPTYHFKDCVNFMSEFSDLVNQKSTDVNELYEKIQKDKKLLTDLVLTMPQLEAKVAEGDYFFHRFMDFYDVKRQALNNLEETCKGAKRALKDALRLLDVNNKERKLDELLDILDGFQKDLQEEVENVNASLSSNANNQNANSNVSPKEESGGVLDNLVSNIQSGQGKFAEKKEDKKKGGFFSFLF